MNTKTLKYSILLALVFVMGVFGSVYAQGPKDPETTPLYVGNQQMAMNEDGLELVHEALLAEVAEVTGVEVSVIEARLDAGETLFDIYAAETGLPFESFMELMADVHTEVMEQAIADGLILGRGGRWVRDDLGTGYNVGNMYTNADGTGVGDGICLSEDGEPLYDGQQVGARGARGGRGK